MNSEFNRPNAAMQFLKIFISYSHTDLDAVQALCSRLKNDGVDVWLDKEDLSPGQHWQNEIRRAIIRSDLVIVCLSRGFNKQHGFRHEELKIALEKAKWLDDEVFIIPVRLEKCETPEPLGRFHRVDLFESGGYERLLHALRRSDVST